MKPIKLILLLSIVVDFSIQQSVYATSYPARGIGFATLTLAVNFPSVILIDTEATAAYTLKNESKGPLKFVDQSILPAGITKITDDEAYCSEPVTLSAGSSCLLGYRLFAPSTPTTITVAADIKPHISGTNVSILKKLSSQTKVENSVPTIVELLLTDIRLFKDHTKYIDVTNTSSSVIANNVNFNLSSIPPGKIASITSCPSIAPGATCRMYITAVAGETLTSTPITIQGSNTNPAAATLTIYNSDEIQITPQSVFVEMPGNTTMTIHNSDSLTARISSMIFGSGIHNVTTNLSTFNINSDSDNTFNILANNVSYGSDTLAITYNTPQLESGLINASVAVANTTISLLDYYKVPINSDIILEHDTTTMFYYNNIGNFDWINPNLSISPNIGVSFVNDNCTSGTIHPGANCSFALDTDNAPSGGTTHLIATGDNITSEDKIIIVEGNYLTFTPDIDSADLHLSYRAIKVTNANATYSATIDNIEIYNPLTPQIYYCNNIDPTCSYKTDSNCTNGGTIAPFGSCRIWYRANDSAFQTSNSGTFRINAQITMNSTPYHEIETLNVAYSEDLYVGGAFNAINYPSGNGITKWNGTSWSALGSGISAGGIVYGLRIANGDLYVGGDFTSAGGISAKRIAKWDGNGWSSLGAGINLFGFARAFTNMDENLYVGGYFNSINMIEINNVGRWDINSNTWSNMGIGLDYTVLALHNMNNEIYAGGAFSNYIAKWNNITSIWEAVGGGGLANIETITSNGETLYVGGEAFSNNSYVARWNSTNGWEIFPSIFDSHVFGDTIYAISFFKEKLYVGGTFANYGYNYIAAATFNLDNSFNSWNNATGSDYCGNLNIGTNSSVMSLDVGPDGNYLYAATLYPGINSIAYCFYNSDNSGYQQWTSIPDSPPVSRKTITSPSLVITD